MARDGADWPCRPGQWQQGAGLAGCLLSLLWCDVAGALSHCRHLPLCQQCRRAGCKRPISAPFFMSFLSCVLLCYERLVVRLWGSKTLSWWLLRHLFGCTWVEALAYAGPYCEWRALLKHWASKTADTAVGTRGAAETVQGQRDCVSTKWIILLLWYPSCLCIKQEIVWLK